MIKYHYYVTREFGCRLFENSSEVISSENFEVIKDFFHEVRDDLESEIRRIIRTKDLGVELYGENPYLGYSLRFDKFCNDEGRIEITHDCIAEYHLYFDDVNERMECDQKCGFKEEN